MKNSRLTVLNSLLLTLVLSACSKEEALLPAAYVDPELQPYLTSFVEAAANRRVDVAEAVAAIDARFTDLSQDIGGQCRRADGQRASIRIDVTYWRQFSAMQREFLIFHELGHCILEREHLDEADAQGNCLSIMNSGFGKCRNAYSRTSRERYLDELFHPDE